MKRFFLIVIVMALFSSTTIFAQQRRTREPKNKFGAIYHVISGTNYTLTNKTTSASESVSESIVGAMFFYERIFDSKFSMGLKGTSFLERTMTMEIGTETLDIIEKSTLVLLDFKAYQKDHTAGGAKPYLGVGLGSLTVTSDLTAASDSTTSSTSATIPVTVICAGIDYFWESGGFRGEIGLITGERSDLESNDTYNAKYQMTGTAGSIGVYWLF